MTKESISSQLRITWVKRVLRQLSHHTVSIAHCFNNRIRNTIFNRSICHEAETPTFTKTLANVNCKDRDDLELKIRVTGIPRPTITWLKDGEPIKEDGRHKITTHVDGIVDSTFSITTFSQSDVGEIRCQATNVAGSAQTKCNLKMQLITPTFDQGLPKSAEVDEGDSFELKAKIDGSPMPEVAWFKDGEKIVPDDHIKIETLPNGFTKLTIDRVNPTDCGAYKLIISNSTGEHTSLCAVAVKREYNEGIIYGSEKKSITNLNFSCKEKTVFHKTTGGY